MADDYGRKIGKAFLAIHQLYAEAGRLLQDCDGTVGKGKALATKSANAIMGVSYSLGQQWMAWGAFRCYEVDSAHLPGAVDAVSALFYDLGKPLEEPLLLAGRLHFRLEGGQKVQDVCRGYELIIAFREAQNRQSDVVVEGGPLAPKWGCGPVERFRLIGVPLLPIDSIQAVEALIDRVRTDDKHGAGA